MVRPPSFVAADPSHRRVRHAARVDRLPGSGAAVSPDQVAYTCGSLLYRLYGGHLRRSGLRTVVDVNSIIATFGHTGNPGNMRGGAYTPPLNNQTLFRRDAYLCLYCGARFVYSLLSRDHVTPFSRGGKDTWSNVVSACRRCNNAKASRTPEQAGMQLSPYRSRPPTRNTSSSRAGACSRTRWNTWSRTFHARARCTNACNAGRCERGARRQSAARRRPPPEHRLPYRCELLHLSRLPFHAGRHGGSRRQRDACAVRLRALSLRFPGAGASRADRGRLRREPARRDLLPLRASIRLTRRIANCRPRI